LGSEGEAPGTKVAECLEGRRDQKKGAPAQGAAGPDRDTNIPTTKRGGKTAVRVLASWRLLPDCLAQWIRRSPPRGLYIILGVA